MLNQSAAALGAWLGEVWELSCSLQCWLQSKDWLSCYVVLSRLVGGTGIRFLVVATTFNFRLVLVSLLLFIVVIRLLLFLVRRVVAYCGGLPLALEVIGTYLYGRTKKNGTEYCQY